MEKVLRCTDIVPGCEAVVAGSSDEDIVRQAAVHAREVHGLNELDAATEQAVRAAIKPAAAA